MRQSGRDWRKSLFIGVLAVATLLRLLVGAHCWAARWPDERQSGPFYCHADFPLDPYLGLIDELKQLQTDLVHTLAGEETREIIHIYMFGSKVTYQRYMHRYFPHVPQRRALFIKDRGPGMVFAYRHQDLAEDLRHECTHALLHAHLSMVPLWLDEGPAEYFEVKPENRAHDNPHLATLKWNLRLGTMASIADLEQLSEVRDMDRTDYRHAWAWVHFLLHGSPDGHQELIRFLADIRAQTPPGKLSQRLDANAAQIDRRMRNHFRTWRR